MSCFDFVSLKKLKSKEEHRLRRKQHKQSFQEKQAINDEILQQKEDSASQIQQKGASSDRPQLGGCRGASSLPRVFHVIPKPVERMGQFGVFLSAWLLYRDRVLLQISQNMELLREEKTLEVSALTGSLRPWLLLDSSKGNRLAGKLLRWEQEQLETAGQVVELLLERNNRVWARVFIQLLSSCLGMNSKLYKWADQLNNAGQLFLSPSAMPPRVQ